MQVTIQMCCKAVAVVICVFGLLNLCLAAPMDSYFDPTEDNEMANPQRMQLLKDLRQMMLEQEDRAREQEIKRYENTGLYRVLPQMQQPQKRFRPFRTQTRAGGVALCLWKVCPAAPWLVSKRR